MQNAKLFSGEGREIREFKEIREIREFRDIHCKFMKLPILIKLLTFLLPGIVFDTYEGGGAFSF